MSDFDQLFEQYEAIHKNKTNRLLHVMGIPVIMYAIEILLHLLRLEHTPLLLNAATLLILMCIVIVLRWNKWAGLSFALLSLSIWWLAWLTIGSMQVWQAIALGIVLFVVGWCIQFTGHYFEGQAPQFASRPQNLLLGPISVLSDLFPALRQKLS